MRRRRPDRREVIGDGRYNSVVVGRFIRVCMYDGKLSTAESGVYAALDRLKTKTGEDNVVDVFQKALDNVRPHLEVKSRRVGGATYQVPIEVRHDRSIALAMRWIRDYARGKKGRPFGERLSNELLDAYKGEGSAVKKREDTHKMAEANRAFAHYRW
jgi:small subunit ribosomal protein S7